MREVPFPPRAHLADIRPVRVAVVDNLHLVANLQRDGRLLFGGVIRVYDTNVFARGCWLWCSGRLLLGLLLGKRLRLRLWCGGCLCGLRLCGVLLRLHEVIAALVELSLLLLEVVLALAECRLRSGGVPLRPVELFARLRKLGLGALQLGLEPRVLGDELRILCGGFRAVAVQLARALTQGLELGLEASRLFLELRDRAVSLGDDPVFLLEFLPERRHFVRHRCRCRCESRNSNGSWFRLCRDGFDALVGRCRLCRLRCSTAPHRSAASRGCASHGCSSRGRTATHRCTSPHRHTAACWCATAHRRTASSRRPAACWRSTPVSRCAAPHRHAAASCRAAASAHPAAHGVGRACGSRRRLVRRLQRRAEVHLHRPLVGGLGARRVLLLRRSELGAEVHLVGDGRLSRLLGLRLRRSELLAGDVGERRDARAALDADSLQVDRAAGLRSAARRRRRGKRCRRRRRRWCCRWCTGGRRFAQLLAKVRGEVALLAVLLEEPPISVGRIGNLGDIADFQPEFRTVFS